MLLKKIYIWNRLLAIVSFTTIKDQISKKTLNDTKPTVIALSYRPDIDGLRAIAILSVLGFHAYPKLFPGGFIGVDIFFVISGFLISSIIFRDLESNTFSFRKFYVNRIRRLFPALILVLVAVTIFGWVMLIPEGFNALGKNIVAGTLFVSNLLTFSDIGYFDAPAQTKPLIHLWSLGVVTLQFI